MARAGLVVNSQTYARLQPGDPDWEIQAPRMFLVADVERDLGAIYPKPVPIAGN